MLRFFKLLVFILFFSIAIFLFVPIQNIIVKTIEKKVGLTISYEKLEWTPPLGLTFHNLILKETDNFSLKVKKAYISPSIREIINGSFAIRSLHLKDPFLELQIGCEGEKKIFTTSDALNSFFNCSLEVSDFQVTGLNINGMSLSDLSFQGSLVCDPEIQETSALVSIRKKELALGLTSLIVTVQRKDDKLNASFSVEEKQGGALCRTFFNHEIKYATLKGAATSSLCLSDISGKFEIEGHGKNTGEISSHGNFSFNQLSKNISTQLKGQIKSETLGIIPIALTAAGQTNDLINGKISLERENTKIEGDLSLRLFPLELDGSMEIKNLQDFFPQHLSSHIKFRHTRDSQNVDIVLKSKSFIYQNATANNVQAIITLKNLISNPEGSVSLKAESLKWKEQEFGNLSISSELQPGKKWPFKISIGKDHDSWNATALGEWLANGSKITILLNEMKGWSQHHTVELIRPFEILYEYELPVFSPLAFKFDQTDISFTMQENKNGFEIVTNVKNLPFTTTEENLFNINGNIRVPISFEEIDMSFEISKNEDVKPILLQSILSNKDTISYTFTIDHPKDGLLSEELYLSGGGIFHENIFKFTKLEIQNPKFEATGNIEFDVNQQKIASQILLKGPTIRGELSFETELPTSSYHSKGKVFYENFESPLDFTLQGNFNEKRHFGNGLTYNIHPRLENITLKAEIDGPLDQLKGVIDLSSTQYPDLNLKTRVNFSQNKFALTIDKDSNLKGFLADHSVRLAESFDVKWKSEDIELTPVKLNIDKGTLILEGQTNLDTFKLSFKGANLPYNLLPDSMHLVSNGKFSTDGQFEGSLKNPKGKCHLAMEDIQWNENFYGKTNPCKALIDLSIDSNYSSIQGQIICTNIEPVTFSGSIPLHISLSPFNINLNQNENLDFNLNASGALGPALDVFINENSSIRGYLSLSLKILGTLNEPQMNGFITLNEGYYENFETGTLLQDITLKARSEGRLIHLESIQASDNKEGSLTGEGFITLDKNNGFPFKINCHLNTIQLIQTDFVSSAFEGNVELQGNNKEATLTGTIQAISPHLYIPEEIPEGVDSLNVTFVNLPENATKKKFEENSQNDKYPIHLALEMTTFSRLHIRGRGLTSSWKGQVHLTGLVNNPILHGEMKINNGHYLFKGKNFDIHQGTISFAGPFDTKTKLYVIASLEIEDILIEAILRGSLKNPSLAFRSNPPMSQRQILSYLLFGKGTSEITPYEGNQLSHSISNISTADNSSDLLSKVRDRLRIDRLDINREITSEGNKVSVQVGKYISRGMYVSLNKSITDDSNSISIDAKVSKHIKARAEVTDNAETQFLLKWKHDF